ncbi:MAG: fused MFS/spermidine synthase [Desulfurococcales archaeon]|nr:fused MFS/spermidine synthase [Desulfurococcales archaeon]
MKDPGMYYWNWHVEWDTLDDGHLTKIFKVHFIGSTKYQQVEIMDLGVYGKSLVLDGKIQSSLLDEKVYHEALVHPPMLLHPNPRRVLILGGGEGATAREVLKHNTVEKVVMVDIDRELIEIAKKLLPEWHQGSFDDVRLELLISDARKYVFDMAGKEEFDVIIGDLVDPLEAGPAVKLYTREFYAKLRELLSNEGVFVTQSTSPTSTPRAMGVIKSTLETVFGWVEPYMTYMRSFDSMWGFNLTGMKYKLSMLDEETFRERVKRIRGGLHTLDYQSIVWMRSLPLFIRRKLGEYRGVVSTDNDPVFIEV